MAVVVGGFGFQTVTERVSKAKHIQFLSGVYILAYWLSALLWDFIIFSASCCLLLVRVPFPSPPHEKFLCPNYVINLTLPISYLCSLS